MANAIRQAVKQTSHGTNAIPGGGIAELWQVFDAEPIATTANVESLVSTSLTRLGFLLVEFEYFGLWIQATSATGTADVLVEIQQSYNDTAANYIEPAVGSVVVSALTNEAVNVYALTPSPMPFMRIQVTGNAANPADTVVTAFLWMQS